jgi:uncharacterized repeat protein (TIGR01451 family)
LIDAKKTFRQNSLKNGLRSARGDTKRVGIVLKAIARLLPLLLLFHFHPNHAEAQQIAGPPSLNLGDAVVTGFSGTVAPDPAKPLPAGKSAVDLTFINPDGPSARIMDVRQATANWDGSDVPATLPFDVHAGDVGQVFGIALDDQAAPNIYLSATSAFGLQLVGHGADGQPARVKLGGPGETWMKGQFGVDLGGGPGSVFKVDGTTGAVSLFANVAHDGVPNPAAALGSLAFDAAHHQLFVSDLYTGMVHRLDLNGNDLGHFDQGVTGRTAAHLAPVPFNASARPNIAVAKFDTQKPATWGFAPPTRSVWGLAVHDGRLFYAVADGPQIWSVGIQQDGSFAADPRWEIDVPAQPGPYQVSDILFSQQGAMILAQRAPIAASYDYSAFTTKAEPRVLRYRLDNPKTPGNRSRWIAIPDEYAVGFAGKYRNTNGGVALGYDYGPGGALNTASCEATLWTTGQDLRDDPALQAQLLPGGPLVVHGLFTVPVDQLLPSNTPPWQSYSVDYDSAFHDPAATGHLGQVRIFTTPCAAGQNGGPAVSSAAPAGGSANGGGVTPGGGGNCSNGTNPDGSCVPPYDLAIVKTGVVSTTSGGITFTLAVSNPGATISNVAAIQVTDVVPANMTFTAATGTNWSCTPTGTIAAGGTLTCTYTGPGPIASGAALPPIAITATPLTGGSFKNCASVGFTAASGLQDSNPSNNTSCANVTYPNYDLAIAKTGAASATVSGGFTFNLAVTNPGAAIANAAAIQVTDVVPVGMTFTAATGTNWNCTPAGTIAAGGTLTCTYTGTGPLASGAALPVIAITATALQGGSFKNCSMVGFTAASGMQDSNASNNTSCATVTEPIDLAIAKTYVASATTAGGFTFTLAVTNPGATIINAAAIQVTDTAPAGMTFTAATGAPNWNCVVATGGTSMTCSYIGPGPILSNATLAAITVTATSTGTGPFKNCAVVGVTAASGLQDSNPTNNTSCVTVEGFLPPPNPPNYIASCGVNVIFVIDESGSIAATGNTGNVINAVNAAAQMFNTNGAQAAVVFFNNYATTIKNWSTANLQPGVAMSGYAPANETNWQDAMNAALTLVGTAPANIAPNTQPIIIFVTDGNPDAYGPAPGTPTTDETLATNQAIPVVQSIYTAGVKILGFGIGVVDPTHLNALLGGNTSFGTYSGLQSALQGLAGQVCPGLVLTKSMSPDGYAFAYTTWPPTTPIPDQITLTVTNFTGSPVSSVTVQDALPSLPFALTNPTGFSASSGTPLASGTVVNWSGISLAANGGSATLKFKVDVVPPASQPTSWICTKNFAQVTAINGVAEAPYGSAPPSLMQNPVTGLVHEPDEGTDEVCMLYYVPCTNCGCTDDKLLVTKSLLNNPEAICTAGGTCTFQITVAPDCKAFSGPVVFGDGFFSGSSPASPPPTITSITTSVNPSSAFSGNPCPNSWSSTSTPTSCTANVNLSPGQSITFDITVSFPSSTPPGQYKNCFLADGMTPQPSPANFTTAYNQVNPQSSTGYWGACVPFGVAAQAGVKPPVCTPPMIAGPTPNSCICPESMIAGAAPNSCVCRPGTQLQGKECVPIRKQCTPPQILNADGVCVCPPPLVPGAAANSCVCPEGTVLQGRECVRPVVCKPPQALNAAGVCMCPPPLVMNPATGQCGCPEGTVLRGRECVRPIVCKPPQVLNPAGTACECPPPMITGPTVNSCRCPEGMTLRGKECVRSITCTPPMIANPAGTACECPQGTVQSGRECVQSGRGGGAAPGGRVQPGGGGRRQ